MKRKRLYLGLGVGVLLGAVCVTGATFADASPDAVQEERLATIEDSATTTLLSSSVEVALPPTTTSSSVAPPTTTEKRVTTTMSPKPTSTVPGVDPYVITTDAPKRVAVGAETVLRVTLRMPTLEGERGVGFEAWLVDSTGKPAYIGGTGALMTRDVVLEDKIYAACRPLAEGIVVQPGSIAIEGVCKPGIYRVVAKVLDGSAVVAERTIATVEFV